MSKFQTFADFDNSNKNFGEETQQLLESLYKDVADLRFMAGLLPCPAEDFGNSLKIFTECYPLGKNFERLDEPTVAIESFMYLPDFLREWVGSIDDNRVWDYGWVSMASLVTYEAQKLIETVEELVKVAEKSGYEKAKALGESIKLKIIEGVESSDLPAPSSKFSKNPDGRIITNAHMNVNEILKFLETLKDKGEVNLFDALLNKDARNKNTLARRGEGKLRDPFFTTINALETQDTAPEESSEMIRQMAERFEKLSADGRRRAKKLSESMDSLVKSLEIPAVKSKLEKVPGVGKRINKFKQYAEALSSVAKEMHDLAGKVLQLKTSNPKKAGERQKTWNLAKELVRTVFKNPSGMGGTNREIDVNGVIGDLKKINMVLDQAREELVPQYRVAKSKGVEGASAGATPPVVPPTPPTPPGDPEEGEDLSKPEPPPGKEKLKLTPSEVKAPEGYYTSEEVEYMLNLNGPDELVDLVQGHKGRGGVRLGGVLPVKIQKVKGVNFYRKSDIDQFAKLWPEARPLPEPEETKPEAKPKPAPEAPEDLSPAEPPPGKGPATPVEEPEGVPGLKPHVDHEPAPAAKEAPLPPRRPGITDPDWEDSTYSYNSKQAYEKPITNDNLKEKIQKSVFSDRVTPGTMPDYQTWIRGDIPQSFNPWVFYLALRGKGDEVVGGNELDQRIEEIIKRSSRTIKNNPWALVKAYETLTRIMPHEGLEDGPSPEQVAQVVAKNPPLEIQQIAKQGRLVSNSFFGGRQLSKESEVVKDWLDEIPSRYNVRSMAADVILSLVPGGVAGSYFTGKL